MTPPTTLAGLPAQRRRRPRRAVPPPPDWRCENCTEPNAGRRRRCGDCGTSRW